MIERQKKMIPIMFGICAALIITGAIVDAYTDFKLARLISTFTGTFLTVYLMWVIDKLFKQIDKLSKSNSNSN